MIKIIIVEDENIVRLGLSTLLPWQDYNFELCGLFRNGKEALDYMLENPVDIVITDIKMPVMDGEQLTKEIRAHNLDPYIIILSNYDDFNLVKTCFQYGVCDYLLKQDLEKDTLLNLLQDISKKIVKTSLDINKPDISAYSFFNELVKIDFQEDISHLLHEYRPILMKIQNRCFCVCIADVIHIEENKRYTGINPLFTVLEKAFQEILNKYAMNYVYMYTNKSLLLVLCPLVEEAENFYNHTLPEAIKEANARLQAFFNINLRVAASKLVQNVEELSSAYRQAKASYSSLFYTNDSICVFSQQKQDNCTPSMPSLNYQPVRKAINMGSLVQTKEAVNQFFSEVSESRNLPPEDIFSYIKYLFMDLNQYLEETFLCSLSDFEKDWNSFEKVYNMNFDLLKNYVFGLLNKIENYIESKDRQYDLITKAKQFVNEHYTENINLQSVADYLHVNASYFSSLFKSKTNVSFTQYLTEFRIQKAIILIRTSNKSVEEISESVGYSNPNYFIKVFKKITGNTISEYKKNHIFLTNADFKPLNETKQGI